MGRKEYSDKRARLRTKVMKCVREYQFAQDKTVEALAESLHERLILSKMAAAGYISHIRQGLHPGYSTEHGRGVPFSRLESLRLSKILEFIGVSPSDSLIGGLKRESSFFEYPYKGDIPIDGRRKYAKIRESL